MINKQMIIALSAMLLFNGANNAQADLLVSSVRESKIVRFDEHSGEYLGDFVTAGSGGLSWPHGLAYGPDRNLYVASWGSGQVLRYDGDTGQFLSVFAGGLSGPAGLDFGPDGHLYVVSSHEARVVKYDGKTGAFLAEFKAPASDADQCRYLALSPGGDLFVGCSVYNPSYERGGILRFNVVADEYLGTVVQANIPANASFWTAQGLIFHTDSKLYVSDTGSGFEAPAIFRYDGITSAYLDAFVPTVAPYLGEGGLHQPGGMKFGPDGNLYVGSLVSVNDGSGKVLRYNGITGAFIDEFVKPGHLDNASGLLFTSQRPSTPIAFKTLTSNTAMKFGRRAKDDTVVMSSEFTLGDGSNGIDPAIDSISLQIGPLFTTLPPNTLTEQKPGVFTFTGKINDVDFDIMLTTRWVERHYHLKIHAANAELSGAAAPPLDIKIAIGNDQGDAEIANGRSAFCSFLRDKHCPYPDIN